MEPHLCDTPPPAFDWSAVIENHDARLRRRVRWALHRFSGAALPERVEEVVQEVYCRLLADGERRLCRLPPGDEAKLAAYLCRVAVCTALDDVRLHGAAKRRSCRAVRLGRRLAEELVDPRPNPEQRAIERDRLRLFLRRCRDVRGLGPGRRNAWVMRLALFAGWSSREIASTLGGGLSPRGVNQLFHRMRHRLRHAGLAVPKRSCPL